MLNAHHQRRMLWIAMTLLSAAGATALVLYALRQNINLFFTPTEVAQQLAPHNAKIRLGGMVEKGSLKRLGGLKMQFRVTDFAHTVTIEYSGILPDLFREGQGIVALGRWQKDKGFVAEQVLAKHDEKYMPPEVKHALDKAGTAAEAVGL